MSNYELICMFPEGDRPRSGGGCSPRLWDGREGGHREQQIRFPSSSHSEIHSLVSTLQQLQNLKWSYITALLEPSTEMSLYIIPTYLV